MRTDVNLQAELSAVGQMAAEIATYRGYSAYEIAVQHGFEGTEEDWLASLHASAGKVNGQGPDKDGNITVYAGNIQMDAEDPKTVKQTVQEMNTAIGQKATTAFYTATLTAAGWTGSAAPYVQEAAVEGLLGSDSPIVAVSMENATTANYEAITESWTNVSTIDAGNGKITAKCFGEKPAADLTLLIKVVR